jgi:transposase-like protein
MRKQKNYDKIFKQTILELYENRKSLKELSREYSVNTQSIGT